MGLIQLDQTHFLFVVVPLSYCCFTPLSFFFRSDLDSQCFFNFQTYHRTLACIQMPSVEIQAHHKIDKTSLAAPRSEYRRNAKFYTCTMAIAPVDDTAIGMQPNWFALSMYGNVCFERVEIISQH